MTKPPDYVGQVLPPPDDNVNIILANNLSAQQYKGLYGGVGEDYFWVDRLRLSDEKLLKVIRNPAMGIYLVMVGTEPAGFAELVTKSTATEVVYFGLFSKFLGRGLGKYFLRCVVQEAWQNLEMKRLWLHTCVLDHKRALPAYESAGFQKYHTRWLMQPLPDTPKVKFLLANPPAGVRLI